VQSGDGGHLARVEFQPGGVADAVDFQRRRRDLDAGRFAIDRFLLRNSVVLTAVQRTP
jgi:hypothetical protein